MFDFIRLVYGLFVVPYTSHFGYHVSADVFVKDINGVPITNAVVKIISESSCSLAINSRTPDYDTYVAKTGTNGIAVVEFRCPTGRFEYSVTAPRYYTERKKGPDFKTRKSLLSFDLVERQKRLEQVLYKVRNPIDLVVWPSSRYSGRPLPADSGVFGFDLEKNDWIVPYGKGKISDFSVEIVHREQADQYVCTGALVFRGLDGAYRVPKFNTSSPLTLYGANVDAVYTNRIEFSIAEYLPFGHKQNEYRYPLEERDCLVIRSRTVVDAAGKMKAAHYSVIDGPLMIDKTFQAGRILFNPNCNDTNLERKRSRY